MYRIGCWEFEPGNHDLRRGSESVKLEYRAARTLQFLCERRGHTVSQDEIATLLWGTRRLSPNSVPVVIRDLRRALGDDARNPSYIETVAKGGYRMIAPDPPARIVPIPASPRRRHVGWAAAVLVLGLALAAGVLALRHGAEAHPPGTLVVLETLRNETGSSTYDPLARACAALIVNDLGQYRSLNLIEVDGRGNTPSGAASALNRGQRVVRLRPKIILWSGDPEVSLVAEDAQSSKVIWSGSAFGPEPSLPLKLAAQLANFASRISRDSRARPARS